MRVLHLISSAGLYGAEKMVVTLCRALLDQGVRPTLEVFRNTHLPNTEVARYGEASGVDVRLLHCRGRFDPRAVRQLRTEVAALKIDIVHTHGFKSNLYGFLATRRSGTAFVSTCHRFDQTLRDTLDRPILRRADRVIAVSAEAAESLRSVYGLDPARVVTIPNGISIPADAEPPSHREGAPLVGMAARLAPEKAPQDFLQAAAQVLAVAPGTRFIVAGDGPLMPELIDLRRRLKLEQRVVLAGFVADMASFYASLDVLVQPSYREGMPMTLLEAMARGVPVVATAVGAAPDFVRDGVTGVLVEPGDVRAMAQGIAELVTDSALRERIGATGRADVRRNHSDAAMAARYAQVYRAVVR